MKTLFWNVDTTFDFMRRDGKLYVEGAEGIEGNLGKLTRLAKDNEIVVVNTADWHTKDSKEISSTPNYVTTFPEHCMQNTQGAEFVPATMPEKSYKVDWKSLELDEGQILENRNLILYKDHFDIFRGNPNANHVVEILAPERAIVYGVATNVCVHHAVLGLLERKVQVYVPLDAIKELPGMPLPYEEWKARGAILTMTDEVYKILEARK